VGGASFSDIANALSPSRERETTSTEVSKKRSMRAIDQAVLGEGERLGDSSPLGELSDAGQNKDRGGLGTNF